MPGSIRYLFSLPLFACLALASGIVTRENAEIGAWAIMVQLCSIPLALACLRHAGRTELMATVLITAGFAVVNFVSNSTAFWQLTITVEHRGGTFTVLDDHRYAAPEAEPARIPFHGVNELRSILVADTTACTASWWNGSDHVEVKAPLRDFFGERSPAGLGRVLPSIVVLFLSVLLLAVWSRAFVQRLPPLAELLHTPSALAITFVLGVLIAAVISPPTTWLSSEFLSRPDDWLFYEVGARAMLQGDPFLLQPPGGVEMWSMLYTPIVALLHLLLGPALGTLYIVQFALYLLFVPLAMRLAPTTGRWQVITGIAALSYVLIDLNLHYAWRLLSDALPLLLMVLLFIALRRRRSPALLGLLCGALYLVRLEMIGVGVLVFAFFLLKGVTSGDRWRFVLAYVACLLPYFIRWWALHHNIRPFPIAMEGTGHLHADVALSADHLGLMLRALMGDYSAINPDLRFRWHWLAVHAIFLVSIVRAIRTRLMDRTLFFTLAFLGYVLATRLLSPSVGIYGHRHSLALVALELVFAVLVLDRQGRRTTFAAQPMGAP